MQARNCELPPCLKQTQPPEADALRARICLAAYGRGGATPLAPPPVPPPARRCCAELPPPLRPHRGTPGTRSHGMTKSGYVGHDSRLPVRSLQLMPDIP